MRFLEMSGKFFFQKLRPLFFFLFLSMAPLASGLFLFSEKQSLEIFQEQFSTILLKVKTAFAKKMRKEKFLEKHAQSNPYFLESELESLNLLEREKLTLKRWATHPAIANKEALKNRLSFLESSQNRLGFVGDEIQFAKTFKETLETQKEPVEVDGEDLMRLLSLIEGVSTDVKRPQLIITDFALKKKKTELQNEVFELKMDLLKREFQ